MVDFENGNAERPFVLGAHYNGAAKSGYKPTTKAIHTQSGTKILLNDAEGSVRIEDASGNVYEMDGKGTIEVKAPKNIIFTAGEDLKFSAGRNMTTNVANNLTTNVGNEIIQDSGRKTTFSSGTDIQVTALRDIDIYGKEKLIGYTDGKTELGAKERMHIYGTNSLITAQDKIEYKAPKMNKLPEQGEFKYDKEKHILSVEWINNDIEQIIDTAYIGEKVSLLVKTRNYEEGETISITIKEKDGKDVADGNKELVLTGTVDKEGYAVLKKGVDIQYSEREIQKKLEEQREKEVKEAESKRSRELFRRYCTFEED